MIVFCANAQDFIGGFEDIPLIPGFDETGNDAIAFGNEETRYIETFVIASSNKQTFAQVKKFYLETLPQLGWKSADETDSSIQFYRENDMLDISKTAERPLKLSITLKNRN